MHNYNPNEFGGSTGGGGGNSGNQPGTGSYSGRFSVGSFSADALGIGYDELKEIFNNTARWEGVSSQHVC